MSQEEFQHQSKSAHIQEKVKKFSKEKSKKIMAEIKKKVSSSKHSELTLPSQSDLGTIKSMVVFDPTIVLEKICERPSGLTEVRRDGKDNAAVIRVIQEEFKRCEEKKEMEMTDLELTSHMRYFASACWLTMESLHLQMLKDETPENERVRMDPDHWYELNLTNAFLFANLAPEKVDGMQQLVPGRLFTTRMPRDLNDAFQDEAADFIKKCKHNQLKVVFCLTEPEEFEKYSGVNNLLEFYKQECGLTVYNRSIPDFQIPTEGDLVDNILDLTYHLAKGDNCLVHCAGGTGRTGMVVAAIIQNFGVNDVVSRIRKVKSTYVETPAQEMFLKKMPRALNSKIVKEHKVLACAIAAEHLINVFRCFKGTCDEGVDEALKRISSGLGELKGGNKETLQEAYGQIFDIIDDDQSGHIDNAEFTQWLDMVGAEVDMSELKESILGDENSNHSKLTRSLFTDFMSKKGKHHLRHYELGSVQE